MARVISEVTALLFFFMNTQAFDVKEIVPGSEVAAEIGSKLVLNCSATGCESPAFSWRTQLDSPLGGTVSNQGSRSVLTMDPVTFANQHDYLCSASCGGKNKQRTVSIRIFSFPSDPIIEVSGPLVLGKQASITCRILNVYSSAGLDVYLKKGEALMPMGELAEDFTTASLKTISLATTFTPTETDIGGKITCEAKLSVENLESKQRQTMQILNVNYGPQKTHITASPGITLLEDGTLMLHCMTESNPPARILWKKQLANETLQSIGKNHTLSIPNVQFDDSGVYICEVTNEVTNKTENRTVTVSVQGAPRLPEFSILPSATVNEGEKVTLQCSVESSPAAQIVIRRKLAHKDEILESKDGIVHIPGVTLDDAGSYECEAENKFGRRKVAGILSVESFPSTAATLTDQPKKITEVEDFDSTSATYNTPQYKSGTLESKPSLAPKDRSPTLYRLSGNDTITYAVDVLAVTNGTEKIEILIVKTEEPNYVAPVIIGVSSVATVAGPVAAILVYISRKAKINGSYSLVKPLQPQV
ncbi:PREDICTED: vascular cell adhesion protein 1 isoform X1 [Gekko japonicus]|uniref:Vascular cell adhesion protein 1 isoform X1 n=1 Tax=Gekko japonicus TaxID=146911 RepID=A0ABM1K544_GEKJA|nr:PREDICTED: vascular cell adhesion protein 1 isoform X1 [Gekko japonicus]